jgi:hypothetical protein
MPSLPHDTAGAAALDGGPAFVRHPLSLRLSPDDVALIRSLQTILVKHEIKPNYSRTFVTAFRLLQLETPEQIREFIQQVTSAGLLDPSIRRPVRVGLSLGLSQAEMQRLRTLRALVLSHEIKPDDARLFVAALRSLRPDSPDMIAAFLKQMTAPDLADRRRSFSSVSHPTTP